MGSQRENLTITTAFGTATFVDRVGYVRPGADYWYVDMGRLDWLNGPSSYPFPSSEAAFRFGSAEKRRAAMHTYSEPDGTVVTGVDRDIAVRCPTGFIYPIDLTDLGDIDDDDHC